MRYSLLTRNSFMSDYLQFHIENISQYLKPRVSGALIPSLPTNKM